MLQHLFNVLEPHWGKLLGVSLLLLQRWLQRRQLARIQSSHYELSVRREQRATFEQNETIRIISTAYATEEPPTLDDLLSNAERDWSLRSSDSVSRKTPEQSYNRPTRSSIPPPPPPRKR